MAEAYFTTPDGSWFTPTPYTRGPWDLDSCHAGPPAALMVRALEALVPNKRLARIAVELLRPIPMSGFRVQSEVRRPGRSVTLTEAEILDDDRVYAQAFAMHLRQEDMEVSTAPFEVPDLAIAIPGPFPIHTTVHGDAAFPISLEVRYDPSGSQGVGGPTTMWTRSLVPILADEEPSGLQRICPLADSGNGISYNDYLDEVLFINTDLLLSTVREPQGEWFCSRVESHWSSDGTGIADAELFDLQGPVGRATQNLLLTARQPGSPHHREAAGQGSPPAQKWPRQSSTPT